MNENQATETENGPEQTATAVSEDMAQIQKERDEYFDLLQRTRAEFANYQKRSKAQAEQNQSYAVAGLALDLLAVLDNFERAREAAKSSDTSAIVEGLDMVHRQLLSALGKHGIEPIEALGHPFDPNQHEALVRQPSADHPEGTVVLELGRGYRLKDRILRPSKVAVSAAPH
jgi:molecular chaperone GrpE